MDVDGVLTRGDINVDHKGDEFKVFNVQDGFAIVVFQKAGFKTAIITARSCRAVAARAKDLKINRIFQDAYPKIEAYEKLLQEFDVKDEQVCFIGDDLPDLAVLKRVGLAVAVKNAVDEIKDVAHYVTRKSGGEGAVREVIELILKGNGQWAKILQVFS